jgi:hypothetical protein
MLPGDVPPGLCSIGSWRQQNKVPPPLPVYDGIGYEGGYWKDGSFFYNGAVNNLANVPVPFVIYALEDCAIRVHNPDGSTRDINSKAGTAFAGPITVSHTAENVGPADCSAIFIERK